MSGVARKTNEIYRELSRAIQSPFNLLLEGESGVGKKYFAELIHQERNWGGGFVAFDFQRTVQEQTRIVEQLISRVFSRKRARFVRRDTFFMRRVDLLEAHLLARFSDFLEELGNAGGFPRIKLLSFGLIGSLETDRNTKKSDNIQLNKFLDSLFCMRIRILPLRERKEEIPELVGSFISLFNGEHKRNVSGVATEALELLLQHDWPNNVCELRMEIERAVALTGDDQPIRSLALSPHLNNSKSRIRSVR